MSQVCLFLFALSATAIVLPTDIIPQVTVIAYCLVSPTPVYFPHRSQSALLKWNLANPETTPNMWACSTGPLMGPPSAFQPHLSPLWLSLRHMALSSVLSHCVLLFNLCTFTHDVMGDSSPSSAFRSSLNFPFFLELKFSCLCAFVRRTLNILNCFALIILFCYCLLDGLSVPSDSKVHVGRDCLLPSIVCQEFLMVPGP